MNGSTNVQMSTMSGAAAIIIMSLLAQFAPTFMASAPMGLEAAITTIFVVIIGLVAKPDAGIKAIPGTGTAPPS